ncbi:MAG: PDZ domain-containing protein [Tannerella sp.]|jgi:carboxyl-terminal processing protease|nr:PDZ domain-containing protein [Tannerella sp.]
MSRIKLPGILFLCISCCGWNAAQAQDDNRFAVGKQLEIFNALLKEVDMFYVDSLDVERTVRRGIDAMLKGLDPYTEYYPEERMDNLKFMTTGEYGGIGAIIRQRDEGVVIGEPYEGMPAQLAGLKTGDLILAIDTTDVSRFSVEQVSNLLKGVPNSRLTVKIQRPGEKKPRKIELARKQITIDQVVYYGVRGDHTGYICLQGFTDKSTREVKAAFEDLKQNHRIESLILDLRNNGGGILDEAVQIVNLFVPKGKEVLSTRGKIKQRDRIYRTPLEPLDTVMPLAVLINGESASSAEIVCGALQDMDRAILVGERSFGKGLVQSTRDLPYEGKVKVTISKYYIPSGRCIQAIDYTHRQADGSVAAIPDSLTSIFHTSNGRPVRDGGGIRPDFEVEELLTPTMLYYLASDNALFDYVTQWTQKHKTIPPVEEFVYSDKDYETFKACLKEKGFSYDRQSEKMLKSLKSVAEIEGYTKDDPALFADLEAKLTPDLEKDLVRYEKSVRKLIAMEIVKRYYYRKGEVLESLKEDKALEKAMSVLNDPPLYRKTLNMDSGEEMTSVP